MTTSSTDTLRVFIAARPDAAAQSELEHIQRDLKMTLDSFNLRVRWTDPSMFHITLLFLGDIPVTETERFFQCLEKTARMFPAIGTSLKDIGLFKKSGALWVGINPSPELLNLQAAVSTALGMEAGRFHAHFTLGRIKRGLPDQPVFQTLETVDVQTVPFEIRELELVKSELFSDGPKYTVLGTVRLQ